MVDLPPVSSLYGSALVVYNEYLKLQQKAKEAEADAYDDEGNKPLMRYAIKLEKQVEQKAKAVIREQKRAIASIKKKADTKVKREKAKVSENKKPVLKAITKIAPNVCVPPKTVKVAPKGYQRAGKTVKGYCRRPPIH